MRNSHREPLAGRAEDVYSPGESAPPVPADAPGAPGRDRFADLLRTLALGAVVLGHWLMAAIGQDGDGALTVDNVLNIERWMWPLTWVLVLIPLFFFVGGFSTATSWARVRARAGERARQDGTSEPTTGALYRTFVRRRLGALLRPLVPFLLLVAACVGAALALGAPPGLTRTVTVVVVMPLWFVAVFAVLALLAPPMLALHRRSGPTVVVVLAVLVVLVELVRMSTDDPRTGYVNYVLVWGAAQQLGFAYADGSLQRLPRRHVAAWAALALAALVAVTASPLWPASMIGLSGERSNFSPPGTVPLLLTLVQIPAALLLRPLVAPLLDRPRTARVLDVASGLSMRAFLWHLPVLVAVTGLLLLLGVPFPEPGGSAWWWSRLLWLPGLGVALAVVLVGPSILTPRRRKVGT